MWIRLLTSPFWSGTGNSLKEDASVITERDIQADRRSRSSCQLGHAGYAAESLVRARLSHRCLPSDKRGGTLSVRDTTWNSMSLCNCSHQFCRNIPVSFDFITTWNQGVFLCSPCIYTFYRNHPQKTRFYHPLLWLLSAQYANYTTQKTWNFSNTTVRISALPQVQFPSSTAHCTLKAHI